MEVLVHEDYGRFTTSFYLRYERNGRRVIIGQKDGLLCEQTLEDAMVPKDPILPLIEMPFSMANDFIKGIADYAANKGVSTENENLLKGKLVATEKHLDDMRKHFTTVLARITNAT